MNKTLKEIRKCIRVIKGVVGDKLDHIEIDTLKSNVYIEAVVKKPTSVKKIMGYLNEIENQWLMKSGKQANRIFVNVR